MTSSRQTVEDLLREHGRTFADEAGITLRDKPSALFELLVLAMLCSAPIGASVAAASARELFAAGWRTPDAMLAATWRQRVSALGRGGYKRYDESTARNLEAAATLVKDRYAGDLRRLYSEADGDVARIRALLQEFPRIGPTGSAIFCREVQAVWPDVRPFFDPKAITGADKLGLPTDPACLAELVPADDLATFAAALVRAGLAR